MDQNDENIIRMIRDKKVIVLMNKSDLKPVVSCSDIEKHLQAPIIEISAREETGLDAFENTLKDMFLRLRSRLLIVCILLSRALSVALEIQKQRVRELLHRGILSIRGIPCYVGSFVLANCRKSLIYRLL